MNVTNEDMQTKLKTNKFLGFQIFKKWEVNESKLKELSDKAISSFYHRRELAGTIIKLMRWTGSFDKFNRSKTNPNLFILTKNKPNGYSAVNGLLINQKNTEFPDRFILFKKLDEKHSVVLDFGGFIEKDKIDGLTNTYKMNPDFVDPYSFKIREFIQIVEKLVDLTNDEFIIENNKIFEQKIILS